MERNPSAVVALARNTGCRLIRTDFDDRGAFRIARPAGAAASVTSKCTQLATTIISTMVGAGAVGGVKGRPTQPPSPIDATTENIMTSPVAATPARLRVSRISTSAMIARLAGREDLLAVDRRLREGVVDQHRPDCANFDAGKPFLRLGRKLAGEFGDLGHADSLVFLRQFHGDIDRADAPVPRDEAALEPGVGESRGADPVPFRRVAQPGGVHEVAHEQLVAVRRRMLEIRE